MFPRPPGRGWGAVGGLERLPFRAALQALHEALVANAPPAGQEVEVVCTIAVEPSLAHAGSLLELVLLTIFGTSPRIAESQLREMG
jgi:hypothetical protein